MADKYKIVRFYRNWKGKGTSKLLYDGPVAGDGRN